MDELGVLTLGLIDLTPEFFLCTTQLKRWKNMIIIEVVLNDCHLELLGIHDGVVDLLDVLYQTDFYAKQSTGSFLWLKRNRHI